MPRVSEVEQQFLVQVARFQFVAQLLQRRLDGRAFQLEQINDLPNTNNTHKKPAAVGSEAKENKGEQRTARVSSAHRRCERATCTSTNALLKDSDPHACDREWRCC
jgi:hypothetical protein